MYVRHACAHARLCVSVTCTGVTAPLLAQSSDSSVPRSRALSSVWALAATASPLLPRGRNPPVICALNSEAVRSLCVCVCVCVCVCLCLGRGVGQGAGAPCPRAMCLRTCVCMCWCSRGRQMCVCLCSYVPAPELVHGHREAVLPPRVTGIVRRDPGHVRQVDLSRVSVCVSVFACACVRMTFSRWARSSLVA